jgi:hypothetical protein
LGLKVSDEFTVPLCATHHHHIHETTKEREWWLERKIDPLLIARALWRESQSGSTGSVEAKNSAEAIVNPQTPTRDPA